MINVGENIRKERKVRNLTQKKLAELAGISNSYLSDIEVGRTSPSLNTLLNIAKALKIEAKDFL